MQADNSFEILKRLATVYYCVHVVDLQKDFVYQYSADENIRFYVSEGPGAAAKMERALSDLVVPEHLDWVLLFSDLNTVAQRLKGKPSICADCKGINIGWFKQQFICLETDEGGIPIKVIHTVEKIDDQKKREENLIRISRTDELTGLNNRKAYEEELKELELKQIKYDLVYAEIDINELKTTNDRFGHMAGDELIVGTAACLNKVMAPYGKVFRIGGDEFAALIYADEAELDQIYRRLAETTKQWTGVRVKELSVSCGLVSCNEFPDLSLLDIAKIADQRMYMDKTKFYRGKGIDRRTQRDAEELFFSSCQKVMRINLSSDTLDIIKTPPESFEVQKGCPGEYTNWVRDFIQDEKVSRDDADNLLRIMSLDNIKACFQNGSKMVAVEYRKKSFSDTNKVRLEIILPKKKISQDIIAFLYVKELKG